MSSSSVCDRASAVRAQIEELVRRADAAAIDEQTIQELLTAAVRLYAARVDQAGPFPGVKAGAISATDALVASTALLKSVNIAPFELGLWQAWS